MSQSIRSPTSDATVGHDAIQSAKSLLTGVHGAGETIRGNFNEAVDTTFGDKAGEAKNAGIAQKGVDEIDDGQYRGLSEHAGEKLGGATLKKT